MQAIFIDAKNQQVTYVNNKGQLEDLYLTLGVDMVEIGWYFSNGDTLWVDEEGLLNGTDFGFRINDRDFVGNGIIYGTNRENPEKNDSTVSKIEDFKITFFNLVLA
jgi:hypothetical protein